MLHAIAGSKIPNRHTGTAICVTAPLANARENHSGGKHASSVKIAAVILRLTVPVTSPTEIHKFAMVAAKETTDVTSSELSTGDIWV